MEVSRTRLAMNNVSLLEIAQERGVGFLFFFSIFLTISKVNNQSILFLELKILFQSVLVLNSYMTFKNVVYLLRAVIRF